MNSITTIYKLPKSRLVAATHTIDNHFIMTDKSNASRQTIYQYKKGTLEVDLHIANKKVVSVSTNGYWRYLDTVCAYLLEQSVVSDALLDDFQNKGIFKGTDPAGEIEIICPCMSVEKDAILDLISNGVTRIEDIMQETGACTVCSTCRPRIQNLLGEKSWILAELKHMENHNEAVISYEIISHEHKLHPHKPGEHLVVMAKIGAHWIERSYTLSDIAENEKLRITIKLKQKGLLSNWLRENANKNMPVYVSQPQGRFILDVASDKPIVCFGGGIGITPFLTYAKALRLHNPKRFMHLIYVVANKSEILFHNELIDIATDMPNFKLTLWDRSLTGYLSDKDILDFATMQPNANIYICGRDDFQSSIASSLAKAHYPRSNIFVEVFTYAAEIKVKSKQN